MNIREALENGPARISFAAAEMEKARTALDQAKHALSVAIAKATIENESAKNQILLQARVTFDPGVIAAEAKVIEAKGAYELKRIAFDQENDTFISARKLAGVEEAEMRSNMSPRRQ